MRRTLASVNFVDLRRFTASFLTILAMMGPETMSRPKPARAEGPMLIKRMARIRETWIAATQPMWQYPVAKSTRDVSVDMRFVIFPFVNSKRALREKNVWRGNLV